MTWNADSSVGSTASEKGILGGPLSHRSWIYFLESTEYPSSAMDMPPASAWSQACMCGQVFSAPHTYTYHMRTCPQMKKRLSSALGKAREVLKVKKRRKMEDTIRGEALRLQTIRPLMSHLWLRGSYLPTSRCDISNLNPLAFLMQFIRSLRQLVQNLVVSLHHCLPHRLSQLYRYFNLLSILCSTHL